MNILHFENLEEISVSTWGTVYRAYDPLLDRPVALKLIRQQTLNTDPSFLLSEARAAAGLEHPNICTIHQVHQLDDGALVMVLNWCGGGSLQKIIDGGALSGDRALEFAVGIVSGLAAIHQNGILHGDIKPGNILIDNRHQPRLADFGLSSKFGHHTGAASQIAGTMPYMAPEIIRGEEPTVGTDIWALGVLLYEMITGKPPFSDIYEAALRYSIEFEKVPDVHLGNPDDEPVLQAALQCLNKNPDQRPASAKGVLALLQEIPEGSGDHMEDDKIAKWPLISAGAALLLVLSLFLGGFVPGFAPSGEGSGMGPSGVAVLPFTSVGGNAIDTALAGGLSQYTSDALLRLEPEITDWWFVPSRRIHLREIDNLTRAYGLTGATYAITGRLEKPGEDLYKLSLRREQVGAGIQNSNQDLVVELIAGRDDLTAWQVEIPRRIVQLLEAPWPENAEHILRIGNTSSPLAFNYFLQGRGLLAPVEAEPDTAAARMAFHQSIQADPNYALGWWGWGLSDEKRGGPGSRIQARQKWTKSMESDPEFMVPRLTMALSFHASEDDSIAQNYLKLLADTHPDDFSTQLALGDIYAALGDSSAAHLAYSTAIDLHPGDAVGSNCLGAFLYNYFGNTEGAVRAFNQAAQEASHDPDTLLFLGACHFANDQLGQAQSAFERSISLERNALALEYLAIIYFYQGSFGRGAALAEELLQTDDSRFEVWNLLGVCQDQIPDQHHLVRGSYEKAAELCRAEIMRTDDRPSLWAMMGLIEAQLGNRNEALQWLQRAESRAPLQGDTMLNLADGFETLGERESALFWLDELFAIGYSRVVVERHPGFANLRADSRYREIQ